MASSVTRDVVASTLAPAPRLQIISARLPTVGTNNKHLHRTLEKLVADLPNDDLVSVIPLLKMYEMCIIATVARIIIEDSLDKFACGPFPNTELNLPTKISRSRSK
jgi:hypothetical protein